MKPALLKALTSRDVKVYLSEGESIYGKYILTAVEQGVFGLMLNPGSDVENILELCAKGGGTVTSADFPFPEALAWLEDHLPWESSPFPSPIYLGYGTPFQQRVWQEVSLIPFGSVSTYSRIAKLAGTPSARAVGTANGSNPLPLIVPCHRVVREDGAMGGYGYGVEMKMALLESEGVPLIKAGGNVKVSPEFLMDAA
jgi:O-6-methylguanine DNA methyltransferase